MQALKKSNLRATRVFCNSKQYGVSMLGGIGCLPMLIQMPFFSAIYFARHTEFQKLLFLVLI